MMSAKKYNLNKPLQICPMEFFAFWQVCELAPYSEWVAVNSPSAQRPIKQISMKSEALLTFSISIFFLFCHQCSIVTQTDEALSVTIF